MSPPLGDPMKECTYRNSLEEPNKKIGEDYKLKILEKLLEEEYRNSRKSTKALFKKKFLEDDRVK